MRKIDEDFNKVVDCVEVVNTLQRWWEGLSDKDRDRVNKTYCKIYADLVKRDEKVMRKFTKAWVKYTKSMDKELNLVLKKSED